MNIRPLSAPSPEAATALREALAYCAERFPSYAAAFADAGIARDDISRRDPFEMLRRLPVIGAGELSAISGGALDAVDSIVDTETSSGSSGGAKLRFISYEDDISEHRFLARLLAIAGIGAADRVACVDTDPAAVMVSFPRACEIIGARQAYCVSVGSRFESCVPLLRRLRPTALVSVPSIILRALGDSPRAPLDSIRTIVYIGEGMDEPTRARVAAAFGAELRPYYGTSETSALGVECAAGEGIHLAESQTRHLFELDAAEHPPGHGELIVSTLEQRGLPLLRYRLGDAVRVRRGACECGLPDPRIDVIGRSDLFASILGSKLHHRALLGSLRRRGMSGPLLVTLDTDDGRELMTLSASDDNAPREPMMRQAIFDDHADIEFLADSGLLRLEFDFRPLAEMLDSRKANRLVDLRIS